MPTEKNAAFLPMQESFKLDRQRVNLLIQKLQVMGSRRGPIGHHRK